MCVFGEGGGAGGHSIIVERDLLIVEYNPTLKSTNESGVEANKQRNRV